jgi:hypothetical protein
MAWQRSQCLMVSWNLTLPISNVAAVLLWVFKTFSFCLQLTQLQSFGLNLAVGISVNNVAGENRHAS